MSSLVKICMKLCKFKCLTLTILGLSGGTVVSFPSEMAGITALSAVGASPAKIKQQQQSQSQEPVRQKENRYGTCGLYRGLYFVDTLVKCCAMTTCPLQQGNKQKAG